MVPAGLRSGGGSPGLPSRAGGSGIPLARDLLFPQDPPSEPGSPGHTPSSRLPSAGQEMPESPASIASSRSTTPLKPKDQSLVGSGVGSRTGDVALNFSVAHRPQPKVGRGVAGAGCLVPPAGLSSTGSRVRALGAGG